MGRQRRGPAGVDDCPKGGEPHSLPLTDSSHSAPRSICPVFILYGV